MIFSAEASSEFVNGRKCYSCDDGNNVNLVIKQFSTPDTRYRLCSKCAIDLAERLLLSASLARPNHN